MDHLPPLIINLQRPSAWPHAVDHIQLRETHISWVLLTGQYAYKIKKPLRFPFVDYSTLERREAFCHQEVRLNSRLAPGIYLGVVPITGTESKPEVGGTGPILEYAVQMIQFDEDYLLSRLIASNRLTPDHIDRLAVRVAEIHRQAACAPAESAFATPAEVQKEARDNLTVLRQCHESDHQIAHLSEWTEQTFLTLQGVFDGRKREGFVRECHGDLHLRNVVLLDNSIELFDGIEFNDVFRWIDIQSDAAFLEMDLADQGRPDLAHRFRNRYLERTGDYPGLAVRRWYLVFRALVRAKVGALRIRQEEECGQETKDQQAELQRYLELATKYSAHRTAMLIITTGVSGSGKTTGTQSIIERLGAIRVRSDIERKRLIGIAETAASSLEMHGPVYSSSVSARVYETLSERCRQILEAGYPAIADATFLRRIDRSRFHELAQELRVPFVIIPFEADMDALRNRIRERRRAGLDASEATVDVMEAQLRSREPLTPAEREFCRTVESFDGQD
ncbi:MAG: AAA family ATPase [Planctomycetaceae bacterium]|nr:AAA family ATPase [Planctomycetaceae bacterium]